MRGLWLEVVTLTGTAQAQGGLLFPLEEEGRERDCGGNTQSCHCPVPRKTAALRQLS